MLTAAYNFVPLSRTVVLPDWASQVSMEVPFTGAVCGDFDLIIEAVTPLVVGGETQRPPDGVDAPAVKHNFALFGQSSLPGTTIKGMLRAVVEIAGFGKIGTLMDDRRFAVRDLQNPYLYTNHFTDMFKPRSRAGWLEVNRATGEWQLRTCDYSLVRQVDLEKLYAERSGRRVNLGQAKLTAEHKYSAWHPVSLDLAFNPDESRKRDDWAKGRIVSRADNVGTGRTIGTVVFTGQPGNRDPRGKRVEFIFHSVDGTVIAVPPEIREDFEHVHRDANTRAPMGNWAFHRARLLEGQAIPVFWLSDRNNDGQIQAMGLAMMFRLAYARTTRDLASTASQRHIADDPDLAETIFGYVRETKNDRADQALAGRVQIEPAQIINAVSSEAEREEILLSPKPGFYPAYVAQRHMERNSKPPQVTTGTYLADGKSRRFKAYTTFMDDQATLRGWKRYPVGDAVRSTPRPDKDDPAVVSRKVFTKFTPLGAGTRFRTKVHVHNLRREELGALLWAIWFGDPNRSYCHSLGLARSLGFGCVRVTVDLDSICLDAVDGEDPWLGREAEAKLAQCLREFECYMAGKVSSWEKTAQIRTLQAMADPVLGAKKVAAGELVSMAGPSPFQEAKRQGAVLAPYVDGDDVWPLQAPPPSSDLADVQGRQHRAEIRQGPRATPVRRFGTLDDERVEILRQDGEELQVRFLDGSIDFVTVADVVIE